MDNRELIFISYFDVMKSHGRGGRVISISKGVLFLNGYIIYQFALGIPSIIVALKKVRRFAFDGVLQIHPILLDYSTLVNIVLLIHLCELLRIVDKQCLSLRSIAIHWIESPKLLVLAFSRVSLNLGVRGYAPHHLLHSIQFNERALYL